MPTPAEVAAAAIASLPGMTPSRLACVLARWPDPLQAARAVSEGRTGEALAGPEDRRGPLAAQWSGKLDLAGVERTLARRGTRIWVTGADDFPPEVQEPGGPAVLFVEGDHPEVVDRPRVAIVGTRAATPHGLADAHELGAHLAAHGVTVVSGMAIGIDTAAHEGALSASGCPVGVVATGLDIVYPQRNVRLFDAVRRHGVLMGENPFGTRPEPPRFPVRNRIIAALADVLVVVEATARGGARITAEWALHYGRPVLALPGSRRNDAAAGCNALLADGAQPLLDPSDILVALGMTPGSRRAWTSRGGRHSLSRDAERVLDALAGEPATTDQIVVRTGLQPAEVALVLRALEREGHITRSRGFTWPA